MSVKLSDTKIWNEDWFINLPNEYKLLYLYIKDEAIHGVWRPNKTLFSVIIGGGKMLMFDDFLNYVNKDDEGNEKKRIMILENKRWFLPAAVKYIIGSCYNPRTGAHRGLLKSLILNKIFLSNFPEIDWSKIQDHDNQQLNKMAHVWVIADPCMGHTWVHNNNTNTNNNTLINNNSNSKKNENLEITKPEIETIPNLTPQEVKISKAVVLTAGFINFPRTMDIKPPDEILIKGLIEYIKLQKNILLKSEQVLGYWTLFRGEIDEHKAYTSIDDLYRHFRNWLRKQNLQVEVSNSGQPKISVK